MAEEPYDDLDIGYVEWPMPTTEEFTVIRFLDKIGVAQLWQKIKDKFVKVPVGGETGQVLTNLGAGSFGWTTLTASNIDIPQASETEYGTVRFATQEEFDSFMNFS